MSFIRRQQFKGSVIEWRKMEKAKRVYVPKDVYDKLSEIAKRKAVSVNDLANQLLEKAMV
jgi:predicted HicB family RNase H-like nuclease